MKRPNLEIHCGQTCLVEKLSTLYRDGISYRVGSFTVWDLVPRGLAYYRVGSRTTVPFLVLYGISYHRMGSRTAWDLVLCEISYRVGSRTAQYLTLIIDTQRAHKGMKAQSNNKRQLKGL